MTFGNEADSLGVASVDQWRAAGLSERQLARQVKTGALVRIRHGIYARASVVAEAANVPARAHALHVAAVIGQRQDTVASHHSAALLHGLDLLKAPPDGTVTVTVPPGRPGSYRQAGVVRHSAELPQAHVTTVHGLRVTTAARTVADIARTVPFIEGVATADSALHQRWASKSEVRRVLAACDRWPGISAARTVVDFANGLSESVFESSARVVFHQRGLPPPELQIPVFDEQGSPIARVDFLWREQGVVAEADGALKYQNGADAIAELRRDRLLRDQGLEVVHFTWAELFGEPERVVDRILEAFRRARRLSGS